MTHQNIIPVKRRLRREIASDRRRGFTLVEVVVGLMLLSTLLVVIYRAHAAHRRQMRLAADRVVACQIADEMLTVWQTSPEGLPALGRGPLPGRNGWWWEVRPVATRSVAGQPVRVIRLEIVTVHKRSNERLVLAFVEYLRPVDPADMRGAS